MSAESAAHASRPLAFVDLETTGGDARHHRVIEVGIVELDADGATRAWSTLVNPGGRIPSHIESFTGITDAMVEDAPAFAEIADEVERRLAGRLFVAHNARFDFGFLRQEFHRLGRLFRADVLCTVKLSRRLYPDQPRHNLDAVMERHGLSTSARHRALGDAQVLSDLWQVLHERWPAAKISAAIAQLSLRPALPASLPPELVDDLPDAPGVYRFFGAEDALLYIGKGKSIRTRVLGHFAAAASGGKDAKLARLVKRLDWTETAGELGALLLEARLIKSERPEFNRRLRGGDKLHAIELIESSGMLQARVVPFDPTAENATELFGLFRQRKDGERALTEIVRSHQLCAKCLGRESAEGSCFGLQVGRCRGACVGQEPVARHNLRVRLALASLKIATWPFSGAIAVTERDARGQAQAHIFDRWIYLGTTDDDETTNRLVGVGVRAFDPDIYRLLRSFLAHASRHAVRDLSKAASACSAPETQ